MQTIFVIVSPIPFHTETSLESSSVHAYMLPIMSRLKQQTTSSLVIACSVHGIPAIFILSFKKMSWNNHLPMQFRNCSLPCTRFCSQYAPLHCCLGLACHLKLSFFFVSLLQVLSTWKVSHFVPGRAHTCLQQHVKIIFLAGSKKCVHTTLSSACTDNPLR